ncbi:MAG TPA: DUF2461 domain-containing protein [Pyrinomonadaceae bacterium]|nr:DUF2461 domain-containing protein [Pyrinomonadaceae bacterium]
MIERSTLKFLKDLAANNNRDWFQANKKLFDAAQDNVTAFTGYLIGEVGKFDDAVAAVDPKSCVFRIYRDVRFSKDKSPYKINLGAYIAPGGRKSMQPGYYFHLQPGASFVAGGKHRPDGPELLKIRTAVANNTDEFLKIVEKKSFTDVLGNLWNDRLKSVPKGFDPDHKAAEYLKLKEFMAFAELHDHKALTSADFPKQLVKMMKEMYPLVAFLRKALA